MISYYINILLFVIIVFIFVNDKIKEHYEKEFIKMITSRVIILLEAKEYDYLQKKLEKTKEISQGDTLALLGEIRSSLHQQ